MSYALENAQKRDKDSGSQKQPSVLLRAAAGVLDLMTLEMPPEDPLEKHQWNHAITGELGKIFEGRLSSSEKAIFKASQENGQDVEEAERLREKYQDIVIEQAPYLGWRLLESDVVRLILARWCDEDSKGLEKLARFFEGIRRYAEVKRNRASLPFVEQEWYQTRKNAFREIRALQKKMSAQFMIGNEQNTTLKAAEKATSAIHNEIVGNPLVYRYLSENLRSFLDYLAQASLAAVFVTRQITPGVVLTGWFDYQGCTPDDKSRQIISRLGSRKRRR